MRTTLRLALLGGIAAGTATLASMPVQAQTGGQSTNPAATAPAAPARDGAAGERREGAERSNIVQPSAMEAGANSFTEGQARSRFEEAGFTNLQELNLDNQGFWRARATQGGNQVDVAMDFRGRIASGQGLANLGQGNRGQGADTGARTGATGAAAPSSSETTRERSGSAGTLGTGSAPDGTAGNPPSTATGRAVDALQGQRSQPDGTPGNPAGTAAGRAIDQATGSGAATNSAPDGRAGNPPSTATGRAADAVQGQGSQPDGTPGNPPGTAASRALDRATGTNTTGANPGAPATQGGGTNR